MSYLEYWRINRQPFGPVNLREDFFEGTSGREAIARLRFLVGNSRSVGLLIGESGSGRTSLLRHASRNLMWSGPIVEPVLVDGRFNDRDEWLEHISAPLGAEPASTSTESWRRVCDAIDSASRQDVRTCLLLDDATVTVAEVVGTLVSRSRYVTAVLSCTPESAARLVDPLGGCPLRIELPSWTLSDSTSYIRDRVTSAGGRPDVFSDAALVRLHELSEGRVGTLGRLAELSLLAGAGARSTQISPEIVEAIQEEMLYAA